MTYKATRTTALPALIPPWTPYLDWINLPAPSTAHCTLQTHYSLLYFSTPHQSDKLFCLYFLQSHYSQVIMCIFPYPHFPNPHINTISAYVVEELRLILLTSRTKAPNPSNSSSTAGKVLGSSEHNQLVGCSIVEGKNAVVLSRTLMGSYINLTV